MIVGGGFFGCWLAIYLTRNHGMKVVVLERDKELFLRASYGNQARVHNGYHYPRSVLTALRSRVNFPRFIKEFAPCIDASFDAYYAVARTFSKVTAQQFSIFAQRIGAPIRRAPKEVRSLFNPMWIEDVFAVTEFAFDAIKLREMVREHLDQAGIEVRLQTEAQRVERMVDGRILVHSAGPDGACTLAANRVFNCTYSRINKLLVTSDLKPIPLKHELTEIALVEPPEELRHAGVTVMCGPFFSIMPFPARGLHSLTHVRYTPHCEWHDRATTAYRDAYAALENTRMKSNYLRMVKDAQRYLPCLANSRYMDSIWEVKTVLPRSEFDDSRPILYVHDAGLPNLTCIMGGKIDNIYDMIEFEEHPQLLG